MHNEIPLPVCRIFLFLCLSSSRSKSTKSQDPTAFLWHVIRGCVCGATRLFAASAATPLPTTNNLLDEQLQVKQLQYLRSTRPPWKVLSFPNCRLLVQRPIWCGKRSGSCLPRRCVTAFISATTIPILSFATLMLTPPITGRSLAYSKAEMKVRCVWKGGTQVHMLTPRTETEGRKEHRNLPGHAKYQRPPDSEL